MNHDNNNFLLFEFLSMSTFFFSNLVFLFFKFIRIVVLYFYKLAVNL